MEDMAAKKYCTDCGSEVREGSRFCESCGNELPSDFWTTRLDSVGAEMTDDVSDSAEAPDDALGEKVGDGKSKTRAYGAIVVLGVVVLIIVIFAFTMINTTQLSNAGKTYSNSSSSYASSSYVSSSGYSSRDAKEYLKTYLGSGWSDDATSAFNSFVEEYEQRAANLDGAWFLEIAKEFRALADSVPEYYGESDDASALFRKSRSAASDISSASLSLMMYCSYKRADDADEAQRQLEKFSDYISSATDNLNEATNAIDRIQYRS